MATEQEKNEKAERRRKLGRVFAGAGATALGFGAGYMAGGSIPKVLSKSPKFERWWLKQTPTAQRRLVGAGQVVGSGGAALAMEGARAAIQRHIHQKKDDAKDNEKVAHICDVYAIALENLDE